MKNDVFDPSVEMTSILNPKWGTIFFVLGGVILLIVGMVVFLLTGLSATSDRVFAIEALCAGLAAIVLIKLKFKRKLVFARAIPIPLYYIWPVLCLYVFAMRPFE